MSKRYLIAITAVIFILLLVVTPEVKASGRGPCSADRYDVTPKMQPAPREWRVRMLIRCAFIHYGIPGQIPMALYVAERESGFYPWAINHNIEYIHDCLGLFQHMRYLWPARFTGYMRPGWFPAHWPTVSALNPRAAALVTARMVKSGGWGPWSL